MENAFRTVTDTNNHLNYKTHWSDITKVIVENLNETGIWEQQRWNWKATLSLSCKFRSWSKTKHQPWQKITYCRDSLITNFSKIMSRPFQWLLINVFKAFSSFVNLTYVILCILIIYYTGFLKSSTFKTHVKTYSF